MILNEQQDPLSLTVKLKNEGKDYTIFISSDQMRCFFVENRDMSGKRVQINKRISRLIQEQLNKMFAKK